MADRLISADALVFKELVQTAMAKAEKATDSGFLAYMKGYETLFQMAVNEAPSVDAMEVAHGRFVDGKCTNCGWFGDCVDTPHYNYCPNCGAKMDGNHFREATKMVEKALFEDLGIKHGVTPEIVVTGGKEKPFYQIVYFDTSDKMLHIGFGSYKLEFVFDWLKEYFGQERATVSDREPEVKVAFEHRWIPVTERLPKLWEDIIAYDARNKEIRFAAMGEDVWYGVRMNGKVTHWMPLPEPPKEVA